MNSKIQKALDLSGRYLINATLVLIALVSCIGILYKIIPSPPHSAMPLDEGWVDENGNPFPLNSFHTIDSEQILPQRIYYTTLLPEADAALIFRCRNCYVNIYINDRLIYIDEPVTSVMYGTSPGSRWHTAALGTSPEPVQICLEVTACFNNSKGLIDNIYLGHSGEISRIIIKGHLLGFIISTFLLITGVILIILYGYMKKHFKIDKDLLFLGLATFFSALWCGTESMLWQFFVGHSELIHLLEYIALAAIPFSFGCLGIYRFYGREKTITQIYSIAACVNLIVITVLNITGIMEFHYTLLYTHILLALMIPLMIKLVLSYTNGMKGLMHGKNNVLIFVLMFVLVVCIAISLTKYRLGIYTNYSSYVRVALLCFLLCLIIYQFNQMVITFSKGLEADMLHELALKDYMTGLFNRTAFGEHRYEYEHQIESFTPVGVIQFDVNNLKKVNDTLGHEKGDQMIKAVAEGLKHAFPDNHTYRMGGDEFLTIIVGINADTIYRKGLNILMEYCKEQNQRPDLGFKLQIAHGFILIKGGLSLNEAMEQADALMYENKRILKKEQT